ncbi:MAG: hypothetical protein K0R50_4072 [Eubacterium sp.]|jgi:hypothetical protein|nr:hypothetical protein [Eubacterium sp.]
MKVIAYAKVRKAFFLFLLPYKVSCKSSVSAFLDPHHIMSNNVKISIYVKI